MGADGLRLVGEYRPFPHVDGLQTLEVSPSGDRLYAGIGDSLGVIGRDLETGLLGPAARIAVEGGLLAVLPSDGWLYAGGSTTPFVLSAFAPQPGASTPQPAGVHREDYFGLSALVASGDGLNLYAAIRSRGEVATLRRSPESGALELIESHNQGSCGTDGLADVAALAVSPDGANLYAASAADGAVATFARLPGDGRLLYRGVVRSGAAGVSGLAGARSLAVSPDGSNVYLAAEQDDAIAVFRRDAASGALELDQVARDGFDGIHGLAGPLTVAVRADGANVYATTGKDQALVVFERGPADGHLRLLEVHGNDSLADCGWKCPEALAVSPDGRNVYVGESCRHAVTIFESVSLPAPTPIATLGGATPTIDLRSPSPTSTPRPTCTSTRTQTPTRTGTRPPTRTRTATATHTRTQAPGEATWTPTATATTTYTPTATVTLTQTRTRTPSCTPVTTSAVSPTPSIEPSDTPASPLASPTSSPTPTVVDTATPTPSLSAPASTSTPPATSTPTVPSRVCAGDCDSNGVISIDELQRAVAIALGDVDLSRCPAADADRDGIVAIHDLILAVHNALGGCV